MNTYALIAHGDHSGRARRAVAGQRNARRAAERSTVLARTLTHVPVTELIR